MTAEQIDVFVHGTAVVDPGARIGSGTRIWHFCHVMGGAQIGRRCSLGQNCFVADGAVLGNDVKVQNNVSIYGGVLIEDDVFLGPSMVFTNVKNPRAAVDRSRQLTPTRVRRGTTIGANATVVCGVVLGEHCFVAAGAVVTHDVPAHALALGTPARQVGWVSRHGERLAFDASGFASCPATSERYALVGREVRLVE
jgi:UDP-2-acetamido-3-amino-2,3-dideoxy-glucuronate N-acetyltransferase